MSAEALRVFREGFCPQLTDAELEALVRGLRDNDPALIQGNTRLPRDVNYDWPCAGACALAYGPWKASGMVSVGDVENELHRLVVECDSPRRLGSGHASKFLNWFDETPREEARLQLLAEVEAELSRRQACSPST